MDFLLFFMFSKAMLPILYSRFCCIELYRTDETTSYILINKDYYIIYIIIHNI